MTFEKKLARFYRVSDKANDTIYDAIYVEMLNHGFMNKNMPPAAKNNK